MQVIKHRSHTAAQASRFTTIFWVLLGGFAVVGYFMGRPYFHLWLHPGEFFGSMFKPHPSHGGNPLVDVGKSVFLPLVLLAGIAQMLKEVCPLAVTWGQGNKGEKLVLHSLGELSDDYVSVTNWVAPDGKRGDVDLMVIGPMGIVTVEVKTYSGVILYENKRWSKLQPNGWKTRLKNVSSQARGHKKAVLGFYKQEREKHEALRELFVDVVPVIVFVSADELRLGELDMPALRRKDLPAYILGLPAKLTAEQVHALAALFGAEADRSAKG